jgi:hypothetical protein
MPKLGSELFQLGSGNFSLNLSLKDKKGQGLFGAEPKMVSFFRAGS